MEKIRLILEPNYSEIRNARRVFREAALRNNISDSDECDIEIVIGEILANAIDHGMSDGKYSSISFYMEVSENEVVFLTEYRGMGVTNDVIDEYKELDDVDALEDLSDHGRGLFIMHNIMDFVDYGFDNGIAKITLKKYLKK